MAYGTTLQRLAYYYTPGVFKDFMTSVYGHRQRRERYGPAFKESLAFLQEVQWWPNDRLLSYQAEHTDAFLRRALLTTPYYHAHPEYRDWRPGDSLQKLPCLTKETAREHLGELYAPDFQAMDPHMMQTGGTTGKPLRFPLSRSCFQREYAFRALHYSWAGVSLHGRDRIAICAGHPVAHPERKRPPFWAHDIANNWVFFSSYHLTGENLPAYVRELERCSPLLLGGYPSSVYLLALAYKTHGKKKLPLKGIITGSETLHPKQREVIEGAFGVKMLDWYGNSEMCGNIVECEKGELHLKLEHSCVEILDAENRPCRPGETGRLVCTGFGNDAFPLVRYEVGDRVTIARDQTSRCGRGGVIIEAIEGRVEDYVFTPDGRMVGRLDHLFKGGRRVLEAQLYQDRVEELVIRVVRAPGYDQADEDAILAEARQRLGSAIILHFEYPERIVRTGGGKFRFVVSMVNQREALRQALKL